MSLPLPQFQASRPEAVQSNVIQQPRTQVSFWGQVLPSLVRGAQTIRGMVEENPQIQFERDNLAAQEVNQAMTRYNASDNVDERRALLAQMQGSENAKMKAASAGLDPSQMDSKNQFSRGVYDRFQKLEKDSTAYRQAGDPAPDPAGVMGQQGNQTGMGSPMPFDEAPTVAYSGPDGQTQAPLPPGTDPKAPTEATTPPAGKGPPQNPPMVASGDTANSMDGGVDPRLHQIADHLKQQGYDVPPDMLHANQQNGVVMAVTAIGQGRAPWDPNVTYPAPLPGTANPAELQAASQEGALKAPRLREIIASQGGLRAMQALSTGKEPDSADMFAMLVDDQQASQLLANSMYKNGASPNTVLPAHLFAMADLYSDPATAKDKLANDKTGFYQESQNAYLHATPAEQAEVRSIVGELTKNTQNAKLLQFKVQSAKDKLAAEQQNHLMAQWTHLQDRQAANERAALDRGVRREGIAETARGNNMQFAAQQGNLTLRQQELEAGRPLKQAQQSLAEFQLTKQFQDFKEKSISATLKAYGLPDSGDQESVRTRQAAEASTKALQAADKTVRGYESILRGYKKGSGLDAAALGALGMKVDTTQPGWEDAAIKRLQSEIGTATTRRTQLQQEADAAGSRFNDSAKATAGSVPQPGSYVRRYMEDNSNWQPNGQGQPMEPKVNDKFVSYLQDMYRNAPVNGRPLFELVPDSQGLKKAMGADWGSLSDRERTLLLDAFNTYQRFHKGKK